MNKMQLTALVMVVIAELVRGGREAFQELKTFIREYRNNPGKFWQHTRHATGCLMLCTLALAPAAFYFRELASITTA